MTSNLTTDGIQSQKDWLTVFDKFIEFLRIDSKEIQAEGTQGSKFELWTSQKLFLKELAYGLSKGIRIFYVLKSRQLGISTISLAIDIFWLALHPGTIGCLVLDKESNRETFRAVIRRYIKSFPKNFFGKSFEIVKGGDNRNMMRFSNGSRLDFLVAGHRKNNSWAESKGFVLGHLCAAKGTPVIVEHGRIKAIEDVRIGEKVLTHTGAQATVVDAIVQPNTKGAMIKISPWLGHPVLVTDEHTIPTQRGIVESKDLKKDDWVVMPLRKIIKTKHDEILGRGNVTRQRKRNKGVVGLGKLIKFNEEFGYAIGYYLSEGHLSRSIGAGTPCGIVFARHRNEKHYADRACEALKEYTSGRNTVDRKDCLTSSEQIYGSAFAQWVEDNFGSLDNKHIPDDVFNWGEDFCRGLLSGLLCGDGSKSVPMANSHQKIYKDTVSKNGVKLGVPRTGLSNPDKKYPLNYVIIPTTRSSLAMQMRDIAASLGYGWGSVYYKSAGNHYGRICKPCWRIAWSGHAAGKLRGLMGLDVIPREWGIKNNKYKIENGLVYIKIKKIESGFDEPEMCDLSVDHSDHTFRTPYMSIGNTEVSRYGDAGGLDNFTESMSTTHPNRLYIYESTANGFNHWRDMWFEAGRDTLTKHRMFIGWWANDLNRIEKTDPRFPLYGIDEPDDDEREHIEWVKATAGVAVDMQQLAWYRWRVSDTSADLDMIHQLQPWNDEQCFVKSGYSFFPMRVVADFIKVLSVSPVPFHGFKYWLGTDFFLGKMEEIIDQDRIEEVNLRIWDEPVEAAYYVIGVDAALGRSDDGDSNTIEVFRCYADRIVQVAEYESNVDDTRQAAWVLAYLAGIYKNCRINIDVTGGYGTAIMNELESLRHRMRSEMYSKLTGGYNWDDFLTNASWYVYNRPDSMNQAGGAYNWVWSFRTKGDACNSFRDSFNSGMVELRSLGFLEQMTMVVRDGSDIGASPSNKTKNKDDLVFAGILAEVAWKRWIRPMLINENYTYDRVTLAESGESGQERGKVVQNIVDNFFARAKEAKEEFDPRPKWMVDRGLA